MNIAPPPLKSMDQFEHIDKGMWSLRGGVGEKLSNHSVRFIPPFTKRAFCPFCAHVRTVDHARKYPHPLQPSTDQERSCALCRSGPDLQSELKKLMFALDDEALLGVTLKSARRYGAHDSAAACLENLVKHQATTGQGESHQRHWCESYQTRCVRAGCWRRSSVSRRSLWTSARRR